MSLDHVDADQDGRKPREVLRVAITLDDHGPEQDPTDSWIRAGASDFHNV